MYPLIDPHSMVRCPAQPGHIATSWNFVTLTQHNSMAAFLGHFQLRLGGALLMIKVDSKAIKQNSYGF